MTKQSLPSNEIENLLDNLQNGINDVYDCPGGHKFDKYERDEAKAAIEDLLIKARIAELNNLPNCNIESKFHGSADVILTKEIVKRIAELQQQLTKNGDKNRE